MAGVGDGELVDGRGPDRLDDLVEAAVQRSVADLGTELGVVRTAERGQPDPVASGVPGGEHGLALGDPQGVGGDPGVESQPRIRPPGLGGEELADGAEQFGSGRPIVRFRGAALATVQRVGLGQRGGVAQREQGVVFLLADAAAEHREPHVAIPHDQPAGPGLLRAVRDFLATEIGSRDPADPVLKFHARVAANALRIAEREVLLAPAHEQAHRKRLAALGCRDDAELCAAIRDGSLDHRFGDVAGAVTAAAVDKLTVANPAHLALPG